MSLYQFQNLEYLTHNEFEDLSESDQERKQGPRHRRLPSIVEEEQPFTDEVIHLGFHCNRCKCSPLKGIRYKCNMCEDYDLCEICFRRTKTAHVDGHHENHVMSAINRPTHSKFRNESNETFSEDLFLERDVASTFKCVICIMVPMKAVAMSCSKNHIMCSQCFQRFQGTEMGMVNPVCPVDNESLDEDLLQTYEEIQCSSPTLDLDMKCKFHEHGCDWTGKMSNIVKHTKTDCLYEECKYANVGCGEVHKRKDGQTAPCEHHKQHLDLMQKSMTDLMFRINLVTYRMRYYQKSLKRVTNQMASVFRDARVYKKCLGTTVMDMIEHDLQDRPIPLGWKRQVMDAIKLETRSKGHLIRTLLVVWKVLCMIK